MRWIRRLDPTPLPDAPARGGADGDGRQSVRLAHQELAEAARAEVVWGMPTQLFGTGMAFPFALLAGRDLGNSRLAEDTALGIALTIAGRPPLFVSEARIHSTFALSEAGADQQRHRWEKGHLDNILDLVPGALVSSLRDRNAPLAALAIDLAVPPLSLLVLITVACGVLGGIAFALGASVATSPSRCSARCC